MQRSTTIKVEHLCCGMESKLIRDVLAPLEAVADVKISLTDRRIKVEHDSGLAPETIVNMLNQKRLGASLQDRSVVEGVAGSFNHAEMVRLTVNVTQISLFVATLVLMWCGFPRTAYGMGWACSALSFALFHEAYLALRRWSPNVELMMAIAMASALAQDDVVEAASVGALVTLMDLVKVFALEAVGRRLRASIVSKPLSIEVPGSGRVPLSELLVGDVFVLRVGDVVPADGSVISGAASLDESRVTGEALPQAKRKGERVLSGSIVSSGYLHVRTEAPVAASFQARVESAVEDAQSTLSEVDELVGRFATWYTPIVLILAVVLGYFKGLEQCLVVLVAGCPCALLGAAPFVQGATLALLAKRHRLLVKRATTLESLARIRVVGFDKTGTLTTGHFELRKLAPLPWATHTTKSLHRLVAAVEDLDNHPLARSLVAAYKGCVADFEASGERLPEATGFQRHGRDGVSAVVEGRLVGVGNAAFLKSCVGQNAAGPVEEEEAEEEDEDLSMPPRLRAALKKKRQKEAAAARAALASERNGPAGPAEEEEEEEEDQDLSMPPRLRAALKKKRQKEAAAARAALASERADGKGDGPGHNVPTPAVAADGATRLADEIASDWAGSGSVLFVILDGIAAGAMLLEDAVKPAAATTVEQLKQLGVHPILLTGDRLGAAHRVAKAVGIKEADTHVRLLPEDKQRHLLTHTWPRGQAVSDGAREQELVASILPKAARGPIEVGFVGDGLNDCPALASAHVGVVLQEVGSQATVDAASAVLQVDIDQLPSAIIIARRAQRLVMVNLCLALSINVGVIALAATVGLPLWLSVLSDSGSLLVVLANSLWPLTWRVGNAPEPE